MWLFLLTAISRVYIAANVWLQLPVCLAAKEVTVTQTQTEYVTPTACIIACNRWQLLRNTDCICDFNFSYSDTNCIYDFNYLYFWMQQVTVTQPLCSHMVLLVQVLQYVAAVCCSVLQGGAGWCSVLQGVAVHMVVLQCVAETCCSVLQCSAWCCSVVQCVAVTGSFFLKCVAKT